MTELRPMLRCLLCSMKETDEAWVGTHLVSIQGQRAFITCGVSIRDTILYPGRQETGGSEVEAGSPALDNLRAPEGATLRVGPVQAVLHEASPGPSRPAGETPVGPGGVLQEGEAPTAGSDIQVRRTDRRSRYVDAIKSLSVQFICSFCGLPHQVFHDDLGNGVSHIWTEETMSCTRLVRVYARVTEVQR